MTQTRTQIPFACRAYAIFVAGMVACYIAFALLPFFQSGAWMFSHSEIVNQRGVPGYPLDGPGVLLALLSGIFVPMLSFLPLFGLGSLLMRGEFTPAVRRVLLPTTLIHGLYIVFAFTYGQTILTWIFD